MSAASPLTHYSLSAHSLEAATVQFIISAGGRSQGGYNVIKVCGPQREEGPSLL